MIDHQVLSIQERAESLVAGQLSPNLAADLDSVAANLVYHACLAEGFHPKTTYYDNAVDVPNVVAKALAIMMEIMGDEANAGRTVKQIVENIAGVTPGVFATALKVAQLSRTMIPVNVEQALEFRGRQIFLRYETEGGVGIYLATVMGDLKLGVFYP